MIEARISSDGGKEGLVWEGEISDGLGRWLVSE